MKHGRGKSDFAIVAVKPANNAERSAAEPEEPRAGTEGNCASAKHAPDAGSGNSVSQALERIRKSQGKGRRRGSPRSSTISASICLRRHSTS